MTKADTDRLHARLDSVADNIADIKGISSANTTNIKSLADTVALLLKRDLEMAHKTPCPPMLALSDRVDRFTRTYDKDTREARSWVMSVVKYVVCAVISSGAALLLSHFIGG